MPSDILRLNLSFKAESFLKMQHNINKLKCDNVLPSPKESEEGGSFRCRFLPQTQYLSSGWPDVGPRPFPSAAVEQCRPGMLPCLFFVVTSLRPLDKPLDRGSEFPSIL